MGGDGRDTGQEEDFLLDQDSPQLSSQILSDGLSVKDAVIDQQNAPVFRNFGGLGSQNSSASVDFEADQRRESVYRKILQGYDDLRIRSKDLEEAKSKILSYRPGAWIDRVGSVKPRNYDVPKTTTLVLVGPKGSGKSSLVNRISKVFEDDEFASERAQVSYNSSVGEGTFFLHGYMIPRCSSSFCLYDTRSLSDNSLENIIILKHWMENGVRHGELVMRDSDSQSLRKTMMYKARDDGYLSSEIRSVNFVIFVVNGLSVLKSMEGDEDAETRYTEMIASAFNSGYLAFKDDKPLLVVTHGDLLSLDERARVRVHLGELLGIPPTTQIFDIPESSDPVTKLTIVDMIRYSLEHAEKNLPRRRKVDTLSLLPCMLLLIFLSIASNIWSMNHLPDIQHGPSPQAHIQYGYCPSPQAHTQHGYCPSPEPHIQHCHGSSPQAHIHDNLSPPSPSSSTLLQEHIQHDPSPQAHIQHCHGPSPLSPPSPLSSALLQEHIQHDPSAQAHIQHSHGPSPQAHIHDNPSPISSPSPPSSPLLQEHVQHDPSAEEHIYNGPLPRVELLKIKKKLYQTRTKIHQKMRIEWSKIRHLWLDD
ncbi:hypothetical protein D8674_003178 [Pyrus ussuriensis x Pyrus communis]|uniref:G domain-containing protein n=1 Tax=Pyrus ussuriensis x Pyrus communis TaxID=2448454 RepID=A0A5N5FH09_9ROSA|nr:hypothetical protein D8674_003178 [Pyrus ussuriensis x Pyrus communis]